MEIILIYPSSLSGWIHFPGNKEFPYPCYVLLVLGAEPGLGAHPAPGEKQVRDRGCNEVVGTVVQEEFCVKTG